MCDVTTVKYLIIGNKLLNTKTEKSGGLGTLLILLSIFNFKSSFSLIFDIKSPLIIRLAYSCC